MLKNRLVLNGSEDELGNIWLATNTILSMLQTVKNIANVPTDKQTAVQTVSFVNGNGEIKVKLR